MLFRLFEISQALFCTFTKGSVQPLVCLPFIAPFVVPGFQHLFLLGLNAAFKNTWSEFRRSFGSSSWVLVKPMEDRISPPLQSPSIYRKSFVLPSAKCKKRAAISVLREAAL